MPRRSNLHRNLRAQQRRPRAAYEARKRKAEDPWEQFRTRVREACAEGRLRPSCIRVADALAERHEEIGHRDRQLPVFIGYGPVKPWDRHNHHQPTLPPLSQMTGLDRRTVMRCIDEMVEAGMLHRRWERPHGAPAGAEAQTVYVPSRRERYREGDRIRYRPIGEPRGHQIGRGGCDRGGLGVANAYWVPGTPGPEPPPAKPPEPKPIRELPGEAAAEYGEGHQRSRPPLASYLGTKPQRRGP